LDTEDQPGKIKGNSFDDFWILESVFLWLEEVGSMRPEDDACEERND